MQRKDIESKIFSLKIKPLKKNHVILLHDDKATMQLKSEVLSVVSIVENHTKAKIASVVSVGKDVKNLCPGDRVLIGAFYGTEIKHDDSHLCKMVLVSCDQIDAIVTTDVG